MTQLLYMEDFYVIECQAKVVRTEEFEGKQVVILDQTCFYPKGGGQDFDRGVISSDTGTFNVEAVFYVDGEVKHVGEYSVGNFKEGEHVICKVDQERRQLNTRLHSAGHTLDMAVRQLGIDWKPGKGAHYPHMCFVEYSGEYDSDKKEEIVNTLQVQIDSLLEKGSVNTLKFMTVDEMKATGAVVPENLPKGKPSRVVFYNDFAVPCGGTHVQNISEIGSLLVTNIKRKDGNIRVSYKVN